MNKTFLVARHEFLMMVRRPSFWVGLIVLPLFVGLAIAIAALSGGLAMASAIQARQEAGLQRRGVVDEAGWTRSTATEMGWQVFQTSEAASSALAAKVVDAVLVVPADYAATGNARVLARSYSLFEMGDLTREINAFLRRAQLGSAARVEEVDKQVALTFKAITETPAGASDLGGFSPLPMAVAIMLMTTLLGASGYLMQTITTEKETRVIEALMTSVTPRQLLAGKVLGLGAVGLIQLMLWVGTSLSGLNSLPGVPAVSALAATITPRLVISLMLLFVLGYVLFGSLMGGLGAMVPGAREGAQMSFFIMLPVLIPVYLSNVMLYQPNGELATFLSLFPLTAVTAMPMRMTVVAVPDWQIGLAALGMALTATVALSLVARLFRAQMLLAGARPNLRQLMAALRG